MAVKVQRDPDLAVPQPLACHFGGERPTRAGAWRERGVDRGIESAADGGSPGGTEPIAGRCCGDATVSHSAELSRSDPHRAGARPATVLEPERRVRTENFDSKIVFQAEGRLITREVRKIEEPRHINRVAGGLDA